MPQPDWLFDFLLHASGIAASPGWHRTVLIWMFFAACGSGQLLLSFAICTPLESRWPLTSWPQQRSVLTDVVYAFFVRIVLFPLISYFEYGLLLRLLQAGMMQHGLPVSLPQALGLSHVMSGVPGFIIGFCLLDLTDYWRHRISHRYGWWYGLHSLHHAEDQMTFWSDDRSHLLEDAITYVWLIVVALALGVPAAQFPFMILLFRLVGSVAHSNTRIGYGWLGERLLISPPFHRSHHALHAAGRHSGNYGTALPWWDMLFGTADFEHGTIKTGDASAPAAMVTGSWGAQQIAGVQRMVRLGRRNRKPHHVAG